MIPTRLYRFTHYDHPMKKFDIWATSLAEARRTLKTKYGRSHSYYRYEIIGEPEPETDNPDQALLDEIAQYLQDTMNQPHRDRATVIVGMIKESTVTPFPDKPSQLTEASAFLRKNVLVYRAGTTPPIGAGKVTGVKITVGQGVKLLIHNFGAPEPTVYHYADHTFTEIDKNN